jgi:plasmid stabilization system protein ParE
MVEYNVKMFKSAQNDFLDIAEHLNTLSPEEATQHFDLIVDKTEFLTAMPESCPIARDAQLRLRGYRVLFIGNHVVFYVINDKTVEFRRILCAKRQYERLI